MPWQLVRESLDAAYRIRLLERDEGSGPWPCDLGDAPRVKLRLPKDAPPPGPPLPPRPSGLLVAEAYVAPHEIQDLAEQIGNITKAAVGHDLKFRLRIELGGETPPPDDVVSRVNDALKEISEDLRLTS